MLPTCAKAFTYEWFVGFDVPAARPVTAHGSLTGRRSSIGRTVEAAIPVSGAKVTPADTMSDSLSCGRMNTCVKGIALFSFENSQRYDVELLEPF